MAPDPASTVARLRAHFDAGATRPLEWRLTQLDGLLQLLEVEGSRLEQTLAADLGKPALEAYATDIGVVASEIAHVRRHTPAWVKPRRVKLGLTGIPGRGYVIPEPLGVALIIGPWNYPVQLILEPLAAAIAAGNAALIKPSELAPATCELLADLLPRYCDPEAVAVVEGDAAVGAALLEQRYDHIFFTGSTAVGRIVYEAAARHLTPVLLELGGKSPVLIDATADLTIAARRVAWGKWLNAGQSCVAPDYALVCDEVRDEFVDRLIEAFTEFEKGTPARDNADFTSIVNERHSRRLQALLVDHGGEVVHGGGVDLDRRRVDPTVIIDPEPEAAIMREEIFGPILPVVTVASMADAVAHVNRGPKPLALYVFTDAADVADEIIDTTSAGSTVVNHVLIQAGSPHMPFGGVGASGIGRYHGRAGFEALSNLRTVLRKPARPDHKLGYPPYSRGKERIVRRFV